MMSIIEIHNKQYLVDKKEKTLLVDKIKVEEGASYGKHVKVLYHKDAKGNRLIGNPYIEDAVVKVTVVRDVKEPKILARRYLPKSGIRKVRGYRPVKTLLRIEDILLA